MNDSNIVKLKYDTYSKFGKDSINYKTYDTTHSINADLLKYILENCNEELINNFRVDSETGIIIKFISNEKEIKKIKLTKAELSSAVDLILDKLNEEGKTSYLLIKGMTTEKVLLEAYSDNISFETKIGSRNIEVSCKDFAELLTGNLSHIDDIKREYKLKNNTELYFILREFVERFNILDKYLIDDNNYKKYKENTSYLNNNYEVITKKVNDSNEISSKIIVNNININKELLDALNKDKPKQYGLLENSIYYYIKLCELLTLDDNYVASNSKQERIGIHESISNISNITPKNNKIVSYEFILIYASILNSLGIEFKLNLNSLSGYSGPSTLTYFINDEYIIEVNALEDNIQNDLSLSKTNGLLKGIRSINTNEVTKNKFNEKLKQIIDLDKNIKNKKELFKDNLNKYKKEYLNSNITKRNKIHTLLLDLVHNNDLRGIDSINYIKNIFNNIIGNDYSIKLNIVSKKSNNNEYRIVIIITLLGEENTYFVIDQDDEEVLKVDTKENIENKFKDGTYAYIDSNLIPGLKLEEGKSYVR